MRLATLFSGIGAPEQAMHRINPNFNTVFACELDKFARQSYSAIYNIDEAHFHKDVHDMDGTQYQGKVDILVGGSPCQAFSIAGLRNGTNDKRGQLIYQYIRIVDEVKAPIIVYENVKGMLSIDGGRTIKEFVQALRDIGYHCHYEVVNTKNYGVPQNRERIFLIGFLDHEAYLKFSFAPKQKLEKRLKDVLEDEVDEKYYLSETAVKGFEAHAERLKAKGNEPTLTKCSFENPQEISKKIGAMRGRNPQNPKSRVVGLETVQMLEINEKGTSNCLTTVQKDNLVIETKICDYQEPKILQVGSINGAHEANSRIYSIDGISPTLMAGNNGGGQSPVKHLTKSLRIRKLTPLECWRLQDFPDEAHNKAKAVGVSNSQLYKQAGNSMSVNVLEMILRQIINVKNSD